MTGFPADFAWGAATAAYQIEGAVADGGRAESIWDRFCAVPGAVRNGESGAVACDFYHRYRADVALMRDLGLSAFRFSIAWPRVLGGAAGLDFYDRLVDELLGAGIEPFPTLYHWDLPQALEDAGGWTAPATAEAFAGYAEAVAARLGDRVRRWMTLNEPWVSAWLGYGSGVHAPGRTGDAEAAGAVLLRAHGLAADVLRRAGGEVGIALNLSPVVPATATYADARAADEHDGHLNRRFLDGVFRGEHPPPDFLGVNYYRRQVMRAGPDGRPVQVHVDGARYTDMDWEVHADGLGDLLVRLQHDYAPRAIHVTENGAAFGDVRGHDGSVRDPERCEYLAGHLDAVARAIAAGVPVRGYFAWSLLDNFEWAYGYAKRFGLVYVDYPTLERVPKDSFHWYRDFIAAQRV